MTISLPRQDARRVVAVLVISGSMGAGKTTVMAEASDLLAAHRIPHAAIDLDALGIVHVNDVQPREMMYRNLRSVWSNYKSAGVQKLLLACAVETASEVDRLRDVFGDAELFVCRLTATIGTMEQRVRVREPGMLQAQFVARVAELDALLDRAHVESFSINNDHAAVTEVARQILRRADWL